MPVGLSSPEDIKLRKSFGRRLRLARIRAGWPTIADACRGCSVSYNHLSDYEAGRRLPGWAQLEKLCTELRLDPHDLLTDTRVRKEKSEVSSR
jgi:transcriptional regulator with XRE-family HTH domain